MPAAVSDVSEARAAAGPASATGAAGEDRVPASPAAPVALAIAFARMEAASRDLEKLLDGVGHAFFAEAARRLAIIKENLSKGPIKWQ